MGQDKDVGHFTFQGTQGRSVIDYVLLALDFIENISDFVVNDITSFSDHTPVELSFKANYQAADIDKKLKLKN